ncbi:hypothetical protein Tco_0565334 [Tanacetum coccineum]
MFPVISAWPMDILKCASFFDFEEDVLDDEVQRNEAIPLSDEEIALDASSEDTLSPRGPRPAGRRPLGRLVGASARSIAFRAYISEPSSRLFYLRVGSQRDSACQRVTVTFKFNKDDVIREDEARETIKGGLGKDEIIGQWFHIFDETYRFLAYSCVSTFRTKDASKTLHDTVIRTTTAAIV